jgi:hypothetical protein
MFSVSDCRRRNRRSRIQPCDSESRFTSFRYCSHLHGPRTGRSGGDHRAPAFPETPGSPPNGAARRKSHGKRRCAVSVSRPIVWNDRVIVTYQIGSWCPSPAAEIPGRIRASGCQEHPCESAAQGFWRESRRGRLKPAPRRQIICGLEREVSMGYNLRREDSLWCEFSACSCCVCWLPYLPKPSAAISRGSSKIPAAGLFLALK